MLEKKYNNLCSTPSDINEHLPTLKMYAEMCSHVTEMGVREIVSTYALLMGKPKIMVSYDINVCKWEQVRDMVKEHTDFIFIQDNTLSTIIDPTNLLFIDTLHNYDQLKEELRLHSDKVSDFIIFHDTTSYEFIGESYDGTRKKGIWFAIEEFLIEHEEWKLERRWKNNNGLTIIKKAS